MILWLNLEAYLGWAKFATSKLRSDEKNKSRNFCRISSEQYEYLTHKGILSPNNFLTREDVKTSSFLWLKAGIVS